MVRVKQEEEPLDFGFSATKLGMEKTLEKQIKGIAAMPQSDRESERH